MILTCYFEFYFYVYFKTKMKRKISESHLSLAEWQWWTDGSIDARPLHAVLVSVDKTQFPPFFSLAAVFVTVWRHSTINRLWNAHSISSSYSRQSLFTDSHELRTNREGHRREWMY